MAKGIVCAGNILIDLVKVIDTWPPLGTLVNIEEVQVGGGGAPFNCLMNLRKFDENIPLAIVGLVGDDKHGAWLKETLVSGGIDTSNLYQTDEQPTSYTDVMTVKNGQRTFFHLQGANTLLDTGHFESLSIRPKIFHLGYPTLLPKLDAVDSEYGTVGAQLLHDMQKKGIKTSVDLVSLASPHFKRVVKSLLPYTDYLVVNEHEVAFATDAVVRNQDGTLLLGNVETAATQLLQMGNCELVVVHFPEGALALCKDGQRYRQPSFKIEKTAIKGTVGAGDTFCAGILYCLHQNYHKTHSMDYILKFANGCARFNLLSATSTGGTVTSGEIDRFIQKAAVNSF